MVSSFQGNKIKSNFSKIISVIFLVFLVSLIPFIEFNNSIFPNEKERKELNSINPDNELKLANGDSILFQGIENALNITDYGNLYELNQEVSLDNEEELNLTYYLDDVNSWKVSQIDNSIINIQDTRNWNNNTDFESFNTTAYQVDETLTNDRFGGTYLPFSDKASSLKNITKNGAIAIRAHFKNITIETDYDFVKVEDEDNNLCYQDTGNKTTPFYTPWVKGDTLQIYIESDNVYEYYGYFIDHYQYINGSFDYFSPNPWSFNNVSIIKTNYGAGIMGNATAMYVELVADQDYDAGYWASYGEDDFAEIYQNLTIPRGSVIDASISFDYLGEFAIETNDFYIYVEINKEKIYSIGFRDLVEAGRNVWHNTGDINIDLWVNNSNIFENELNEQALNFSIGIKSGGSVLYGGFQDRYQQLVWFDNITFTLTTIANSTQEGIELKINKFGLTDGNQWGDASKVLGPNEWDKDPVILTINTTSPSLSFDLNTTLYGFHNTTSKINQQNDEGISYKILENGTIYWEFYHNFYWPSQYSNFEFVIAKPLNWRFLYVKDQANNLRSYEGGDIGDNFLKINKTQAILYGWWSFKAISPNYLNITNTKLLNNGQWVQSSSFKSGDSTRIKTQVNYSNEIPPNSESTYVNLTIYHPNGTIFYEESKHPELNGNGTVFFSEITFGSLNTIGGYYNYTLLWSNGTALGGLESNFLIIHNSSLTLNKPNDARGDLRTDGMVGDYIPLSVILEDSENNNTVSNAIVTYNWTGGQQILIEESVPGFYETIIDTSGLIIGIYRIVINSSKIGYFDSNLTLEINLGEATNLQVIESDYFIEFHGNGTIRLKFTKSDGKTGIDGANIEISNITNPNHYYVNNTGEGIYLIEFNSSFISKLGIYKMRINFTATEYEPQFYIYQFQIIEQSVNLTVLINSQEIEENELIRASYNDIIRISVKGLAINDQNYLSGANITWISEKYAVNLTESANLWYNESITCSSSVVSLGINYVYIIFKLDSYATTTFDFQLLISQKTIEVISIDFDDKVDAEPGEDLTIEIQLKEAGSNTNIDGAIVSYSWEYGVGDLNDKGNGIYELELELPADIEEDDYKVTLIISTAGSVYKATEYSFIVDVALEEEEEGLNLIFWIIIAVLLGVISILGALSIRSYIYLPRKRKKEAELLAKTQRFKDLSNIQAIVVIQKMTGIPVYIRSFGILEKQKKELFSGFIQAITSIGAEIIKKPAIIVEKHESDKPEKLIEIDFKQFFCLVADKENIRCVIILKDKASERLKEQTSALSFAIQLKLRDQFEEWDGELTQFEIKIPPIINEYFELYYKGLFTLTKPYVLSEIRKKEELNKMETRILNVIRSFAKSKSEFHLEYILELIAEENKDLVIEGIESLIKRNVILPYES